MRSQNRYSNIVVHFFILPVLLIFLCSTPAVAGYEEGLAAYESGDYATALKEWKPLAEQGHAQAQDQLGVMYMQGQGITRDYKASVKWFKLAAEQGYVEAQDNLGGMYYNGQGITQDYVRAYMWWHIVASQGREQAAINLSIIQKNLTPTQIEKAQKLAREGVAKNYKGC